MSLLDVLTGGKSDAASKAMEEAKQAYSGIQLPTQAQLTLPELEKYVQAGILTPAEAKVALQGSNAYNDIKLDPSTMAAEQDALAKLKNLSDSGGMDAAMKAQLTDALDKIATSTHGNNAAILDNMAKRGIPTSLMGTAAMLNESGEDARNANLAATNAAGQAETNAINSMMNQGNLASTMHGQNYSEEANKAAAANAIKAWNAGATNTAAENNANRTQEAGKVNLTNSQDVSNKNVDTSNQRTAYNTQLPETLFNNAVTKANGLSGAMTNQSKLAQEQGKQNAGIMSGLLGTAGTVVGGMYGGPVGAMVGKQVGDEAGTMVAAEGAIVPGRASVPGDSYANDKVHARLSPGEIVVPRSIAPHPEAVKSFVQHLWQQKNKTPVHPDDVHSVLEALTKRRAA